MTLRAKPCHTVFEDQEALNDMRGGVTGEAEDIRVSASKFERAACDLREMFPPTVRISSLGHLLSRPLEWCHPLPGCRRRQESCRLPSESRAGSQPHTLPPSGGWSTSLVRGDKNGTTRVLLQYFQERRAPPLSSEGRHSRHVRSFVASGLQSSTDIPARDARADSVHVET